MIKRRKPFPFPFSSPPSLPYTPIVDVKDTYFGVEVEDPYRWLENLKDPNVLEWAKAEDNYTRYILNKIPGREELGKRISQLSNADVKLGSLQIYNNIWFYLKLSPGDNNYKLYILLPVEKKKNNNNSSEEDSETLQEELLFDPTLLNKEGKHYSIDYYQPSNNGELVAIGVSEGGSESSTMRILEVKTKRDLGDRISRTDFSSVSWLPNNNSFFYNRLRSLRDLRGLKGSSTDNKNNTTKDLKTDYYLNSLCYIHHLGDNPDNDVAIFGRGLSPLVDIKPEDGLVLINLINK